jgi:predicted GTPase
MTISSDRLKSYEALITCFRKLLAPLPVFVKRDIERHLNQIDSLIQASRPPRFMIFGQRGAGKSSLINAIFGAKVAEVGDVRPQTTASEWFPYEQGGKILEILDTRGLLDPKAAASGRASSDSAEKTILDAVRKTCPDVALFLCQAKLVHAGIDEVLDRADTILKETKRMYQRDLRIIGVVTQCDLLDPSYIHQLPTDNTRKNRNIETAVFDLTRHISSKEHLGKNLVQVIPISACAEYQVDGTLEPDFRWNINRLLELLMEQIPREAQNDIVRLAKIQKYQESVARTIVCSRRDASGVLAAVPIPIPNSLIVGLMQVAMVAEIIYISGEDFALASVGDFLANLGVKGGAGFVAGGLAGGLADFSWENLPGLIAQYLPELVAEGLPDYLATDLLKCLPGLGVIIAGWGGAKATEKVGEAAIAYFIDKTPIEAVKQKFGFASV